MPSSGQVVNVPAWVRWTIGGGGFALCAVAVAGSVATGQSGRAVFVGVMALVCLSSLVPLLRRSSTSLSPPEQQQEAAADLSDGGSPAGQPVGSTSPWQVETLSDQLPDPRQRRQVVVVAMVITAIAALASIALTVVAIRLGDLEGMAIVVFLLSVGAVCGYGAWRNRGELTRANR